MPVEVRRTLVKSAPELWAELSDTAALARRLGAFGSIRITHAEPEELVEWEGDRAAGSVRLEPSGFGTRVTMSAEPALAEVAVPAAAPPGAAVVAPEVEPPAPPQPPRRGVLARVAFWRRPAQEAPPPAPRPVPAAEPEPEPEPEPLPPAAQMISDEAATEVLAEVLDVLGAANHRPFSRA